MRDVRFLGIHEFTHDSVVQHIWNGHVRMMYVPGVLLAKYVRRGIGPWPCLCCVTCIVVITIGVHVEMT